MQHSPVKISAVIITFNEEKNLGRCLESLVKVVDEIVVLDSLSTDKTVDIAKNYGAKVYQQAFAGYTEQKRVATSYAQYDWIFSIDADEVLTPELQQSILQLKSGPRLNAYEISRVTNYCGKWIRHGSWYPDRIVRLVNRTTGNWEGGTVHEYWKQHDKNEMTGLLKGELLHYSFSTISDHTKKIEKYTEMSARDAVDRGKDCSILKIWLVPKWFFFTSYVLRLGFLDGYYGYLVCKLSAYASMLKYARIRQYAKLKREGKTL